MSAEPDILGLATAALDAMKARDVCCLDVTALTALTDHMLICTGTSNRHVRSLAENLVLEAKAAGHPAQGVEGLDQGDWVLVDMGVVVVHIMRAQTRAFYQLEKLWSGEAADPDAEIAAGP